jgi:hypothetical protein
MHGREENLVKMANQIAVFFASQHERDPAAAELALVGHLKLFWAPAMRRSLLDLRSTSSGDALRPMVRNALAAHSSKLFNEAPSAGDGDEVFPEGGGDAG